MAVRSAEARLSRALARYEWVLAHVANGIYGLDASGRVEFVNPAAARITGYPEAEQLGKDQHQLLHGRRPNGTAYPRTDCPVWRALQTGRTVRLPSYSPYALEGAFPAMRVRGLAKDRPFGDLRITSTTSLSIDRQHNTLCDCRKIYGNG